MDIHKLIGKIPKPKKGFVLPGHKYTGPYNPLDEQLDVNDIPVAGQEPFNNVDAISMRHDICYRDNDTKRGKQKCDDKMLMELEWLEPKDLREKIDKSLVTKIISRKKRLGWGLTSKIKWSDKLADELHKPIRRKFIKRRVFVRNVDDIWAADLVEMQTFAKYNKGFRYILMIIDVFSRFGWALLLKSKTGMAVAEALKSLFRIDKPRMLWTDKGSEFRNRHVLKVLEKNNIKIYSTENEEKASIVERWNRTIKTKMWKYFSANNTKKYIDILDDLIKKYNNTYHRSIGRTPADARKPSSYQYVFQKLYAKKVNAIKQNPKFKVGDKVRISKKKKQFEKGFTPNWTEEIFTISNVKDTNPPTYHIQDLKGESVKGSFYEAELQKSTQDVFRIEKVIRKRTRKNGEKEAYVKWKGYSSDFNSWIPISELHKI